MAILAIERRLNQTRLLPSLFVHRCLSPTKVSSSSKMFCCGVKPINPRQNIGSEYLSHPAVGHIDGLYPGKYLSNAVYDLVCSIVESIHVRHKASSNILASGMRS